MSHWVALHFQKCTQVSVWYTWVPSLKDNPTIEHYIYFATPIQEVNMRAIGICFNAVDYISKAEN